jgi:hypothetical protein
MSPLIEAGSRVLVEFGATPDQVGQVVVFERDGDIVAHRIVGRRRRDGREQLLPKGDAEAYFDRPIGHDDVLGVVRAIEAPHDGSIRRRGIGGRWSRAIAGVSRWSGRGARIARRFAVHSPDPIRVAVLRAIPILARVPTRLMLAPITQI